MGENGLLDKSWEGVREWHEAEKRLVAAADKPADNDGKSADYHGPSNAADPSYPAHKAVHDAAEHLYSGRVTNAKARGVLRDALDQADKAATGRAKSDDAIGRALRSGAQDVGLTVQRRV